MKDVLFIENIGYKSLFYSFFLNYKKNYNQIYYIDTSINIKPFSKVLNLIRKFEPKKLNFKLIDIKMNGELVRLRIDRFDLLSFVKEIENKNEIRIGSKSNYFHNLEHFVMRGIQGGGISDKSSPSHFIYLIYVINWYAKKNNLEGEINFVVYKRPWFNFYEKTARKFKIKLIKISKISNLVQNLTQKKYKILKILSLNSKLYELFFNWNFSRIRSKKTTKSIYNKERYKILYDGRGDVNFKNNGLNSDFNWALNSGINLSDICYETNSEKEKKILIQYKLNIITPPFKFSKFKFFINHSLKNKSLINKEQVKSLIFDYKRLYSEWNSIFDKYNIKTWVSWNFFDNRHMVIHDVLKNRNGVSLMWQLAFNGFPFQDSQAICDIFLSYSKFSIENQIKQRSLSRYYFITGITKDSGINILRKESKLIKKKLNNNGAENIIAVFDENSNSDSRFHTGDELQIDNYRFILEELLLNEKLGVILKPKNIKHLNRRLEKFSGLLKSSIDTGRCILLGKSGRHTSLQPALLAGFASDVCVHAHLSSGTAAIECASFNIPTLLIDREGCPGSILSDLKKDKVVFKNWRDLIVGVNEYFKYNKQDNEFGNWGELIYELNYFRDGQGYKRKGEVLKKINYFLNDGLSNEIAIENTANWYAEKWGNKTVFESKDII